MGGFISFFETEIVVQAALWDANRELIRLQHADGSPYRGSVTDVSNHGYAVGATLDGKGFIWHPSFSEPQIFDDWLNTKREDGDPDLATPSESVTAVAEDLINGKLLFAVNRSARSSFVEVPVDLDVTRLNGTDDDDDLVARLPPNHRLVVAARAGNDVVQVTVEGSGSSLEVTAGDGDDTVIVDSGHALNFFIAGETGTDTVQFDQLPALDVSQLPDGSLTNIEQLQLGAGAQQLRITAADAIRISDDRNTLVLQYDSSDTLQTPDAWEDATADFRDGKYVHRFTSSGATLEIINDHPWQNPVLLHDVNRDEAVTALDALVIINRLGRQPVSELPAPTAAADITHYYDTTGEGNATSLDALRVINELRGRAVGSAAGELPPISVPVARTVNVPNDDDEKDLQATDAALRQWPELF